MFVQREKMTLEEMFISIQADLLAAGFENVYPTQGSPLLTAGKGMFVVESTDAINPVNEHQTYRIKMELAAEGKFTYMMVHVAGSSLITNDGEVFPYPNVIELSNTSLKATPLTMGLLGTTHKPKNQVTSNPKGEDALNSLGQVFIGRGLSAGTTSSPSAFTDAYEKAGEGVKYGYTLSAGDHGVVLYTWENTKEDKPVYSMFCVQSPVDKDTGEPLIDLKSPIFCVYNNDNAGFKKFVVSESDVAIPSHSVSASEDTTDSSAILNEAEQVAVKLDNKYLITFPNRVNTERFAYSEELDMIAYTSARVIGEDTVLELEVYGESTKRKYRAMKANMPHNNGMRLLVLQNGAGVDDSGNEGVGGEGTGE